MEKGWGIVLHPFDFLITQPPKQRGRTIETGSIVIFFAGQVGQVTRGEPQSQMRFSREVGIFQLPPNQVEIGIDTQPRSERRVNCNAIFVAPFLVRQINPTVPEM